MTADLLDLATEAAHAAGAELLRRYGHVEGLDTKTTATDPVSDADRASEALLTKLLLGARPDDGILGEEGASRDGTSGVTWVVDPLDGTVNYLYGIGGWAVSIAADDADGTIVGVVHQPVEQRTFTATRGGGAYLDGTPLHVNEPVPLQQAMLATGFAYLPERRAQQGALIADLMPKVRDIRRIGVAAVDLCMVAAGMVDAYYEEGLNPWDMAAGELIVREAGGTTSDVRPTGGASGVLAAGPSLHAELAAALAEWSSPS